MSVEFTVNTFIQLFQGKIEQVCCQCCFATVDRRRLCSMSRVEGLRTRLVKKRLQTASENQKETVSVDITTTHVYIMMDGRCQGWRSSIDMKCCILIPRNIISIHGAELHFCKHTSIAQINCILFLRFEKTVVLRVDEINYMWSMLVEYVCRKEKKKWAENLSKHLD
ncbi:hypothetical protein BCR41DRAFT_374259 [Lobosporangium transversale]|uniref:Uncharacterized protein n=1 Tax=Lobosporangium transversale TaxID=64571 RepID=A0A1Y2GDD1_9FUNG|nr:hypothetical protein BCR41DRAFT_374259 [Lobosporangium transversale]ORZ05921.1 hypothetical protein BCR41DRAFT_374259 [Lobosporangium transversale]|eukprot:XP_021877302.1 hypothetical protein BCR41DRAFT_374259 [Lobosporangium transversale]